MNLSEQLMELHRPKTLNEKLGFKGIKKLLSKFKPFKKPKKSKNAFNKDMAKKKQGKKFWQKFFESINEEEGGNPKFITALAKHFDVDEDEVEYNGYAYEADGGEYEILTDDEADEKAKQYIEDSVWAFNADFLTSHFGDQENINKNLGLESSYYDEDAEEEVEIEDADEVFYMNTGMTLQEWIADKQEKAEDANNDFISLIDDFDDFVKEAIASDGRGHFLSTYDGEENEIEVEGMKDMYLYRTN